MDHERTRDSEMCPANPEGQSQCAADPTGSPNIYMYSVLMTAKLWNLNARTWLGEYLQACADNGGQAPLQLERFLPWAMDADRLAALRAHVTIQRNSAQTLDTS